MLISIWHVSLRLAVFEKFAVNGQNLGPKIPWEHRPQKGKRPFPDRPVGPTILKNFTPIGVTVADICSHTKKNIHQIYQTKRILSIKRDVKIAHRSKPFHYADNFPFGWRLGQPAAVNSLHCAKATRTTVAAADSIMFLPTYVL